MSPTSTTTTSVQPSSPGTGLGVDSYPSKAAHAEGYIDLGPSHPKWSTWSNNPNKMNICTYFNPESNVPINGGSNEGFGYGVGRLRCVLVQEDKDNGGAIGDTYVAMGGEGRFYYFNEADEAMYRWVDRFPLSEIMEKLRGGPDMGEMEELMRGRDYS